MVELLREDGQSVAKVIDSSTSVPRGTFVAVANMGRTSSCCFGLCCRAVRKLSHQTGLPETSFNRIGRASATQKARGLASVSMVGANLRMMLAAACSVAGRTGWKHCIQPAPSWYGPEDSQAITPSQQFGQLETCKNVFVLSSTMPQVPTAMIRKAMQL